MDDRIISPRGEVTALLQQDEHIPDDEEEQTENEDLRQMVWQLLDPESDLAQRVEEIVIGTCAKREYDHQTQPDENGVVEILPNVLNSAALEEILKSVRNLQTFS
ncbi:uncharacterized protein A1O5_04158 [Cladophialophora psammophila CBS 110553]|uniref:Uncharacterized protein n=1 Tax=Cladophialophora psammophila CBS 110553 TaxID=1182543 RepID=W9XRU0_9EURO|nr:uncharacterized protein A1O5_04158 [Cladophialophora psammophila CBS 110553]EXJ73009.1 hypothetical protein A1O5_04158 [Cladophialophora psammophila CBS 110553]